MIELPNVKHVVVKIEDIFEHLNPTEREILLMLLNKIEEERIMNGKKINEYLVINTDETYAEQVVNILKANGHWG